MKHRLLSIHLLAPWLLFTLGAWTTLFLSPTLEYGNSKQDSNLSPTNISDEPDTTIPKESYPFEFAGCLVTRDDKVPLPEWLAYHYTVLPLRYLIVSVDPRSLTSPEGLFDLYRNNTDLKIEVWKSNWFWRAESWRNPEMSPPTTEEMKLEVRHQRQFDFYKYCLLRLKKLNYTWTAVIDTDEFVTYNVPMAAEEEVQKAKNGLTREQRARLFPSVPGKQNETIAHSIQKQYESGWGIYSNTSLCVSMPRVQFFSKHIQKLPDPFGLANSQREKYAFEQSDFSTLQLTAYDSLTNGSFSNPDKGLLVKSLINVAMTKPKYKLDNPHTIYLECGRSVFRLKVGEGWPYRVHHYSASLKSFVSRPERTPEIWEQRNQRKFEGTHDVTLTKWFPEFIKLMRRNGSDDGVALAYRLTQQAINEAYVEMNDIKRRIMVLNETVAPLYEWDEPLATDSQKLARAWQGL
eukprot:scaffold1284_cov108-Cylindrotheca_fusiformis.AAC.2